MKHFVVDRGIPVDPERVKHIVVEIENHCPWEVDVKTTPSFELDALVLRIVVEPR